MQSNETTRKWHGAMLRFRFAGQVTAAMLLVGWVAWFFPYDDLVDRAGTPLGGDYVMLYVAGQVVADGEAHWLYDDARNQIRSSNLFPAMDSGESWPFRYPPTVAAAMVPLSQLPLAWSFGIFLLVQLSLLAISLWLLRQDYSVLHGRSGWLWGLAGSPLVLETLIGGQSSLLALTCIVGCLHFLRRDQPRVAGMLLALTLYKPNVACLLIVAASIARPKMLIGFLPTAAVGLAIALWTTGTAGVLEYIQLATQLASSQWGLETPYWKVHGLSPYFQWMLPEHGKLACAVAGLVVSVLVAAGWRAGRIPERLAIAILLCCNALLNPYVPIYDLVLLDVALLLACQAAYSGEWKVRSIVVFQCVALMLFVGPHLSQALAQPIGLQLFPLALGGSLLCASVWYAVANWRFWRSPICVSIATRCVSEDV